MGDPAAATTVVNCLTVTGPGWSSTSSWPGLSPRAAAVAPRPGGEATYTGSFTDPDGHVWQLLWMDQLHVVN